MRQINPKENHKLSALLGNGFYDVKINPKDLKVSAMRPSSDNRHIRVEFTVLGTCGVEDFWFTPDWFAHGYLKTKAKQFACSVIAARLQARQYIAAQGSNVATTKP